MDDVLRGSDAAQAADFEPERIVKKCKVHLRNAKGYLEMDLRDPFTCTPFVIVGNGDLGFELCSFGFFVFSLSRMESWISLSISLHRK